MSDKKGLLGFLKLDNAAKHLSGLVETKIELAKVEIKEDISIFLSKLFPWLLLTIISFFCLFFLNMALGIYLGAVTGSPALGYMILGVFYLLLGGLIILLRDKLKLREFFERKLEGIFKK